MSGRAAFRPASSSPPSEMRTLCVGQPISVIQMGFSASPYCAIMRRSFSICASMTPSGRRGCEYGWMFMMSNHFAPPSLYTPSMNLNGTPAVPPNAMRTFGSIFFAVSYVRRSTAR